jgi:hypothetical protein
VTTETEARALAGEAREEGHPGHGRKHLAVIPTPATAHAAPAWRRWAVVGLALAAVALFAASYFEPYWSFVLYAPQYPFGLKLVISLPGVTGDVREIDTINHYIGMGHLADAAHLERQMAGFGVAGVSVLVVVLTLLAGKKLSRLALLPGAALPGLFVADTFYWMYRFGHKLDSRAPVHIEPFTPTLVGNGQIGQFLTFATPGAGFWMAVAATVVLGGAVFLRGTVCATCPQAGACGILCRTGFVLAPRPPREGGR